MLIALTGLGSQTGVTTTAVALAAAWPGPEPAVVLEANPAGGRLAEAAGTDPGLGLASLAASAAHGTPEAPAEVRLLDHVQLLPSGVLYLASPQTPEAVRATLSAPMTVTDTSEAGLSDLVVFADCGTATPGSPAASIAGGADVLVVVVRADLADPALAGRRVREITEHAGFHAVIVIGSDRHPEFADDLGVPILGHLPVDRRAATAVVHGSSRSRLGRDPVGSAARGIAEDMYAQVADVLAPGRPVRPAGGRRSWRRGRAAVCTRAAVPAVYSLAPGSPREQRAVDTTESVAMSDIPGTVDGGGSAPPGPSRAVCNAVTPPETRLQARVARGDGADALAVPASASAGPARVLDGAVAGEPGVGAEQLVIELFGPVRAVWRPRSTGPDQSPAVDVGAGLQRASLDLLVLLAVHPDGLTRRALVETLWAEQPLRRPDNTVTTALGRLRAALTAATDGGLDDVVIGDRVRCRLNRSRVTVDYWAFEAAVGDRRHAGSAADRIAACQRIVDRARGRLLAADVHTPGLEAIREAARRDTVNAHTTLARHHLDHDPHSALELFENAAKLDPYNEQIWQAILRLHARLGELDAVDRTMSLLTRRLEEIGVKPGRETLELARKIRRPCA